MKQKVIETILKHNLIKKGDSIVIGLSGGADSVCLTLILNEIKEEYNLTLKAVHINHLLRGEEADKDMRFCERLCKSLNIDFTAFCIDVSKKAKECSLGFEECAREVRYECFKKVANGNKIATAHNLDDVAETMIFNLARGSSVNGLCSIPVKRENIIRPLIDVSRREIEEFLKEKGQDFVTDSTNLSDKYTRNKIRKSVSPVLKEINPEFLQSVKRLVESAGMYSSYVKSIASQYKTDNVDELKKCDDVIIFEAVSTFLKEKAGIDASYFHLNECVDVIKNGGRCQLPKGYLFEVLKNKMTVYKLTEKEDFEIAFDFEKTVKTPYNNYNAKIISYKEFKKNENVYNLFLNNAIDYDKICNSLVLRNRREGDRIMLKNRRVNRLLKSVYNEMKIPVHLRDKLSVLEQNGKIIWAENIGVSHNFGVNNNTKRVLVIERQVDYH